MCIENTATLIESKVEYILKIFLVLKSPIPILLWQLCRTWVKIQKWKFDGADVILSRQKCTVQEAIMQIIFIKNKYIQFTPRVYFRDGLKGSKYAKPHLWSYHPKKQYIFFTTLLYKIVSNKHINIQK